MYMPKKLEILELIKRSVNFVLVGTTHPGNIGAAARAIKNMGIHRSIFNRLDLKICCWTGSFETFSIRQLKQTDI